MVKYLHNTYVVSFFMQDNIRHAVLNFKKGGHFKWLKRSGKII